MDYSIQERYPEVFNTPKETPMIETKFENPHAELVDGWLTMGATVRVTFTKKDGTPRTMLCTRNMESVPTDKHPKGTGKAKASHLIVAFDLEKGEWRSFDEKSMLCAERVTN
jgi:hypothetical protein